MPDHRARMKVARQNIKRDFLKTLRQTKSVNDACKVMSLPRTTVYRWLRKDPEFQKRFMELRQDTVSELEEIAFQKAREGNDKLLMFLLRSWDKERYGQSSNLNVHVDHDVEVRLAGRDPAIAQKELASKMIEQLRNVPGGLELIEHVEQYSHASNTRNTLDLESQQYRVVEEGEQDHMGEADSDQ